MGEYGIKRCGNIWDRSRFRVTATGGQGRNARRVGTEPDSPPVGAAGRMDRMEPHNGLDGRAEPTSGRLHGMTMDHAGGRSPRGEDTPLYHPHLPHPFVSTGTVNEGVGGSGEVLIRGKPLLHHRRNDTRKTVKLHFDRVVLVITSRQARPDEMVTTSRGTLDGVETTPS